MKKVLSLFALLLCSYSNASVIPVGVQNDITFQQVTEEWGWSLCHSSNYGASVALSEVFSSCTGNYVMLGAALSDSNIIDTLAAGLFSDVTRYTMHNTTTTSNGSEWYYNGYSMGFAGLGDAINQFSADTAGSNERDRLSWHTTGTNGAWDQNHRVEPLYIYNGWRSGNNTNIYTGTNWERLVFTVNSVRVPEPSTLFLFIFSLVSLTLYRKTKYKARKFAHTRVTSNLSNAV